MTFLQYSPYIIPLLISGAITTGMGFYAWRSRSTPGAAPFAFVFLGMTLWSLFNALRWASADLSMQLFLAKVRILGPDIIAISFIIFALEYTGREKRITRRNLTLLMLIPLIAQVVLWTNEQHALFFENAQSVQIGSFIGLDITYGPWFWVHAVFDYLVLLTALLLLIEKFIKSPTLYRAQIGAVVMGTIIPLLANFISISGWSPFPYLDLTPFGFAISGVALALAFFRYRMLDIYPAARDTIFQNMDEGVLVLDGQDHIVDINLSAERILGQSASSVVGKDIGKVLSIWNSLVEQHRDPSTIRETVVKIEDVYSDTENDEKTYRTYEMRVSPISDPGEGRSARVLLLHDITERKRTEESLKASRAKFEEVLKSIEDAFYETDLRGKYTFVNNAFSEALGYDKEELQGRHFRHFTDPKTARNILRDFNQVYKTNTPLKQVEYRFKRRDGDYIYAELSVSLIRDAEGKPTGFRGLVRDVTERNKAVEALRLSEEKYRTILDDIREGYYEEDLAGNFTEVNEVTCQITGVSRETILKSNFKDFTDEASANRLFKIYNRVYQTGEPEKNITYQLTTPNGEEKTLEASASLIRDSNGEAIGFRGIVHDITDRRKAEEQIRKLSRAVEQSPSIVIITNPDGKIEYVNPKFSQISGYSPDEVLGKNPRLLKSGYTSSIEYEDLWKTITSGEEWRGEMYNQKKNGESFWVFSSISPVIDLEGRITHFVAVQEDITERKRSEDLLKMAIEAAEESRAAAEEANQAKSTFLANMSHELRTPLNAIIGYSELLMEDAKEFGQEDFIPDIEKIHGSGKHLMALINDVLDLSKIEAGKMELYLETFDLEKMVQDVVSTIQPLVDKNANKLETQVDESVRTMRADMTKVRQSLFNLLSNACKFTENGTISLEVRRQKKSDDSESKWIAFKVSDTGIGMSEDQLEKLYQPFTQADASTTRKYGGTGLGLTITQRFCKLMGGSIHVESMLGKGSTFTILLPETVSQRAYREKHEKSPRPSTTSSENRLEEKKTSVLVVDDDPSVRDLIVRFLSKEGFQVLTASSGEEGLKMARENLPHAITLDVLMPGMDGWAVLAELKNDPELAQIPVIMVTMVSDRSVGFALGASEYLPKPINRERLTSLLQQYQDNQPGKRVLVVEDDASTREMLYRVLEKEGWRVDIAEHGRAGLERVAENPPSLILLDLLMPEMDGFEFLTQLGKKESTASIPVIVVTAKELTKEDRDHLNGYVIHILEKGTYHHEELLKEVNRLVRRSMQPANPTTKGKKKV